MLLFTNYVKYIFTNEQTCAIFVQIPSTNENWIANEKLLPRHRQLHFCKIIIYSNPFRNKKKNENYDPFKNFQSETEMHENAHSEIEVSNFVK